MTVDGEGAAASQVPGPATDLVPEEPPATPDEPTAQGPASPSDPRHRRDIDGLRAIAVLLVIAYHAGVPFISGGYVGVDVFFVISGFLITGLLVTEVRSSGSISISNFYARRVRRLLPSAALVLIVTVVVGHLVLAPLAAERVDIDAIASALYVSNWAFAAQTSDYFAAQAQASPLLNYWSLGVEEQFYVVWPLLILAAVALGVSRSKRLPLGPHAMRRVAVALGIVGVASFLWSALGTAAQPGWSYYGLHTRAWELAVGAGLALAVPLVARAPARAAVAAGWVGLLLIGLAAVVYDDTTTFPGVAAAVPVVGAALVLASGLVEGRGSVGRVLSVRGMVHIGLLSYTWYLWHWPVLTYARALTAPPSVDGEPMPAPTWALVSAVALSYLLALLTTHLIENPVRRSASLAADTRTSLLLGAALTLTPVGVALLPLPGPLPWAVQERASLVQVAEEQAIVGRLASGATCVSTTEGACAAARATLAAVTHVPARQTPAAAADDIVRDLGACHQGFDAEPVADSCVFGDPKGTRTVVLVGDSKAQHWFPALNEAAKRNGWKLLVWTKSSCPFVDVSVRVEGDVRGRYTACEQWRSEVSAKVRALATSTGVDLVLTGRSHGYAGTMLDSAGDAVDSTAAPQAWADGLARTRAALGPVKKLVVLRDLPWSVSDRPECLSTHPTATQECAFIAWVSDREVVLEAGESAAEAKDPSIRSLTLAPLVCPGDVCRAVAADGTVVFRDAHHMTVTFARSLAEAVGRAISEVLPR